MEIFSGNDVALGSGWGSLETYRGESFRWVENDAELVVAMLKPASYALELKLEPGPGVDLKPFTLSVLDENRREIATVSVKGRHTVSAELIATSPEIKTLVLHVSGGGKSSPNDPRVLNFRVFNLRVVRMPMDVIPVGRGLKLGSGWYPLETFNGETFRWVSNDAHIEAEDPASFSELTFVVESGPGMEFKPFTLRAVDQAGSSLADVEIKGRQPIKIPIPKEAKKPFAFKLHAEGGGKKTSNDSRILNFRVFEHVAGPQKGRAPK